MNYIKTITLAFALVLPLLAAPVNAEDHDYRWLNHYDSAHALANRIDLPDGYRRIEVEPGSFHEWLRYLPLKEGKPPVYKYNGEKKGKPNVYTAVVDIDIGNRNLMQCADAYIRLHAEYLYAHRRWNDIVYNFTSGDTIPYSVWMEGMRPRVSNNNTVTWHRDYGVDSGRVEFMKYLDMIFMYAGTYSLAEEMQKIAVDSMTIGDVFNQPGFPGHLVIVVDMAENMETGEKIFLLAQGFTPAQDVHVINNPIDNSLSPWYRIDFGKVLATPEWLFKANHLMRLGR